MAPRQPQPALQSLPPILSEMPQTPISGCSKGSRGLSVLPRVLGIFTETTISPSPSLRQRPSRYAIRAGRNLPDKEFRFSLLLLRLPWIARPELTEIIDLSGSIISVDLCMSPCRTDHILPPKFDLCRPWRMVSEGSIRSRADDFPADCPHRSRCHCLKGRVASDARSFQHTARFY